MASGNDDGHDSVLERAVDAVAFLRRLDRRNLRMLSETLLILAGPALRDWQYNSRLAARELPRTVRNLVTSPGEMNHFQSQCSVAGYVSTPEDGILAGFTDTGRMSTLLYPHTGFTHQLPYIEAGEGHLDGAAPRDGGFFGVVVDGETRRRDRPAIRNDVATWSGRPSAPATRRERAHRTDPQLPGHF